MSKEKKSTLTDISPKKDGFFCLLFLLTSCFVFWKCRYGYGNIDESFYLTIPYRLLKGDALFQEEWHLSQMSGILTMPFVSAYLSLRGSTEGIILAMRYICTAVQCSVAMFLYVRLRHVDWLGAFAAAICFLLYTPFGIMALSYNSMGILLLTVSQVILLTAQRRKTIQYFIAGLLFAAAVLCCPYLVLVYAAYIVVVVIRQLLLNKKQQSCNNSIWSIRSALYFTMGAAAAAVLFAVFVLGRGSFARIIQAFPAMLNDPEHMPSPRFAKTKTYIIGILCANSCTPYIYAVLIVLWFRCLLDKQRRKHKIMYTVVASAVIIFLMFSHYFLNHYINMLMWSINIVAFFIVLLSDRPQIHKVFATICIPGLLYSYCLHLASNQHLYAIFSAATVACVGSLVIVGMYLGELCSGKDSSLSKKIAVGMLCMIMVVQVTTQTVLRYESIFWDKSMKEMTWEITDGIEKGIITSEELYNLHYSGLESLKQANKYQGEKVLYLSMNTWYYLESQKEMATYSAWLSGVNEHTLDRLEIYYNINPQKLPDVVFADSEYLESAEEFGRRFSYRLETLERGYILFPQ